MTKRVEFEELVSSLPDMVAVIGPNGLRFANNAWSAVLGWSVADMFGTDFADLIHPGDRAEAQVVVQALTPGVANANYMSRVLNSSGHVVHLGWSLLATDQDLIVAARDLSTYWRMSVDYAESLAVASGILATAVDPIIVIDIGGIIMESNAATLDLFGYERADLIGSNVSMLMPEPYRSGHDGYLAAYLAGGDPKIIGRGREVEAQRADGSKFPMSLAVSEVLAGDRRLFTGIIHDLTERNSQRDELANAARVLERRVAERTDELETLLSEFRRSNEDLERFAYVASHDLRAPLRNVRQGLELLDVHLQQTGSGFDEEANDLRGLVLDSVDQMNTLIDGLLSYSRVQTAENQTTVGIVDLNQTAADVLALLATDLDQAGATVTLGELPKLEGRSTLLAQVLQNLVSNAIRYRSPERPLEISISATVEQDHIELTIGDNGVGVDPSQHERIFEIFRRGQQGGQGSGIGLALCRRIIDGHGGSIRVESTVGAGSTFLCRLPHSAARQVGQAGSWQTPNQVGFSS